MNALFLARLLSIQSARNQAALQQMRSSDAQMGITNQLAATYSPNFLMSDSPGIGFIDGYRQNLMLMSDNLDLRLGAIQAQMPAITSEQEALEQAMAKQIKDSAPHYVG
ncbi:hypothetical protein IJG14_06720 [bacterium]|nr:hypothetical protein [bacterium]